MRYATCGAHTSALLPTHLWKQNAVLKTESRAGSFLQLASGERKYFSCTRPVWFPAEGKSSWQTSALRPLRKAERLTFQYQSAFLFSPIHVSFFVCSSCLDGLGTPIHAFIHSKVGARAHNSEFIFRSRPRLFSEGATWRQTYNSAAAAFLSFHFQYEIKMRVIMPLLAPYCARNSFWIFKDWHSLGERDGRVDKINFAFRVRRQWEKRRSACKNTRCISARQLVDALLLATLTKVFDP